LPDAFAAMAILGRLRGPLRGMPRFLAILTEFQVSVQRIESFLRCKEIDQNAIKQKLDSNNAILIRNTSFSWGGPKVDNQKKKKDKKKNKNLVLIPKLFDPLDYISLESINLKIPKRSFVCIVGEVGSGKSSILSSILGDLIAI